MARTNSDASARQGMNSLAERPIGIIDFEFFCETLFLLKVFGKLPREFSVANVNHDESFFTNGTIPLHKWNNPFS